MSDAIVTVFESIAEIHRLMPESILFGSLLLYFLTQNLSFGIFSIFIFETVVTHKLISWMFSQSVGKSVPVNDIKCHVGYKTPRYDYERMFKHDIYPSYGVFSITAIGVYLGLAMREFSSTLEAIDKSDPESTGDWKSRTTVALISILFVISIIFVARWKLCEESLGEMLIAITCALATGGIFFYINKGLFGQESMNFLGLPTMIMQDNPVYVCSH